MPIRARSNGPHGHWDANLKRRSLKRPHFEFRWQFNHPAARLELVGEGYRLFTGTCSRERRITMTGRLLNVGLLGLSAMICCAGSPPGQVPSGVQPEPTAVLMLDKTPEV